MGTVPNSGSGNRECPRFSLRRPGAAVTMPAVKVALPDEKPGYARVRVGPIGLVRALLRLVLLVIVTLEFRARLGVAGAMATGPRRPRRSAARRLAPLGGDDLPGARRAHRGAWRAAPGSRLSHHQPRRLPRHPGAAVADRRALRVQARDRRLAGDRLPGTGRWHAVRAAWRRRARRGHYAGGHGARLGGRRPGGVLPRGHDQCGGAHSAVPFRPAEPAGARRPPGLAGRDRLRQPRPGHRSRASRSPGGASSRSSRTSGNWCACAASPCASQWRTPSRPATASISPRRLQHRVATLHAGLAGADAASVAEPALVALDGD
jgi:hypothetical protein